MIDTKDCLYRNLKDYSYRMMHPGVVEISTMPGLGLNEENARLAIETVKARRSQYFTEEAYLRDLEKREGALAFLLAHTTPMEKTNDR